MQNDQTNHIQNAMPCFVCLPSTVPDTTACGATEPTVYLKKRKTKSGLTLNTE